MFMPGLKTLNRQVFPFRNKSIGRGFFFLFLLFLLAAVLVSFFPASATAQDVIHFSDTRLEAAVRQALNRPAGILTGADLSRLRTLDASRQNITDLSGLEYAINMQNLNLYENSVEDLTCLKGLTHLQSMNLAGNRIAQIGSLQNLTALEELNLSHNNLRNIDVLKNLTRLKGLQLEGNQIGTLTPLEPLRNLQSLSLSGKIADKSAASLSQLTRLQHLSLTGGQISDTSFLTKLKQLQWLDLQDNRIVKIEPLKGLSRLEHLSLANNRIEELTTLGGLRQLQQLNLGNNRVRDIAPLVRLRNIQWIELQNNFLELSEGKQARKDVDKLRAAGVEVITSPQRLPLHRGNGLVTAKEGSGGKLLRTPIEHYFTLLNQSAGWRIKSFTVAHEGAKPLDRVRETGLRTSGAFAWHSITNNNRVGDKKTAFFTTTYRQPGPVQLGLAIQIWPGYARDPERTFYISQVILENMETGDLYTVELERDPPLQNNPAPSGLGGSSTGQDYQEKASPARTDLKRVLAEALLQRVSSLEVRYSGEALQMPAELENMLEDILATDDYLRYSQRSQSMSWSKQPGGDLLLNFRFDYLASGEEENIVNSRVEYILREILKPGLNEHQKTKAVHDYIVANVAYDLSYREHSAYAALVSGRAVCQGYALLMYKMLKEAGFEVRIISGRAGGEDHAWNMVRLDGNWYHIDATWDDPVPDTPSTVRYDYYNRTDAQMAATHTWERDLYPAAQTPYPPERLS
jgi:Leucine-rich repeat (LRR) protein/transglutaminase-like putative cysteine protease